MLSTYFQNLIKVLAIGAGFATIPLFASLAALQPPWPPAIGFVSAALVMAGALIIWEWTRNGRVRHRRRLILLGACVTLLGLFAYLFLYSLFIEVMPGTGERLVRGYRCTPEAQYVYPEYCPDLSIQQVLEAEGDPLRLWTRASITNVRLGLTGSWLLFTTGLIMTVGAVVAGRKFSG